jgi:hypothetical protein
MTLDLYRELQDALIFSCHVQAAEKIHANTQIFKMI